MIGRQEILLGVAAVILIALVISAFSLLRHVRDQLAVMGAGLFIIGAMLFFVVPPVLALMTLGIGLVVLAIRLPRPARRDEEDRISCPFCAEEIKPRAILCPHCRSDLRADDRRMRL